MEHLTNHKEQQRVFGVLWRTPKEEEEEEEEEEGS